MSDRLGTVLFADVSGSTSLYETAGDDAALEAISACLAAARLATEAAGGRVGETIGDEGMAIFPRPGASARRRYLRRHGQPRGAARGAGEEGRDRSLDRYRRAARAGLALDGARAARDHQIGR